MPADEAPREGPKTRPARRMKKFCKTIGTGLQGIGTAM
jgi:hypothetical protein